MNPFERDMKLIETEIPKITRRLLVTARNFFDESWDKKGFTDKKLTKWKPVIDRKGRVKETPLVETANLRGSIRTRMTDDGGIVFTDVDYAKYHNEGGSTSGRPPKRKFMGKSEELDKRSVKVIKKHLNSILK